jgi:hypothetical protein
MDGVLVELVEFGCAWAENWLKPERARKTPARSKARPMETRR